MKKSHFKQISDGSDWNPVKMRKLEAPVTGLAWRLQRKLSKILLILCEKAFKAADPLLSRPPSFPWGPRRRQLIWPEWCRKASWRTGRFTGYVGRRVERGPTSE